MSSYENAPSTRLLATNCGCCGRALRDAASVERGVGPDCAEKYGYGLAVSEPNWAAVMTSATAAGLTAAEVSALAEGDARVASNWLCHQVAAVGPSDREKALKLAAAIRALGYVKMGSRLTERLAKKEGVPTVTITVAGDLYEVKAVGLGDYFDAFLDATRAVPGRRYQGNKINTFPRSSQRALWDALKASVPGAVLNSPKGVSVIG